MKIAFNSTALLNDNQLRSLCDNESLPPYAAPSILAPKCHQSRRKTAELNESLFFHLLRIFHGFDDVATPTVRRDIRLELPSHFA